MKNILLVDDELSLSQQMIEALIGLGYKANHALNKKEAVALAVKKSFDLCIIDYKLKNSNGGIVLKELKKKQPECCFIIVSGNPHIEKYLEKQGGLRLAETIILKPFDPNFLFDKIETILDGKTEA